MTFSNQPESAMTVKSVSAELDALETHYKSRKRKLKALLALLIDEEGLADAAGKEEPDGTK